MGFLAGFSHDRARAALGAGAIVAVSIIVPSAVSPKVTANPGPPTPFDSNGLDNSFAIAQSREQGPVIDGSAPAGRMAADAAVPALGDPVKGTFGPQVGWPIMPIHAVLLPDGRVMSYGTEPDGSQTAIYRYDVWDPRDGTEPNAHVLLPNTTQTDIFCSSQIVLLNGDVAMFGGDNLPTSSNTHNDHVNLFHPASNTIERAAVPNDHMNRLRWYSSATVLPNAEVYIQGGSGGADLPERRNSDGSFTLLSGAPTNTLSSGYPKNWVAPNGLVFGIANNQMYEVNPAGNGTIRMIATASRTNTGGTSTAVMFEPGKILQVGGGSRNASLIDINTITPQLTPVVTPLPQLQYQRQWGNATVMADGRVFVSGGSAVNNAATGVAYTSEIFNPAGGGSWSTGPTATRMRLYHSTSLLLPDASVITMGGGTPGPETNLNAEIYYPPYLFKADGTPAVRPTITTATAVTDPGMPLSIETPDAVAHVSLVKTGSVTHSNDMDQRFLDLPFTQSGGTVTATLPTNVNRTPPGYYMIFVVNAAGVPSEAKFVKINVAAAPDTVNPTVAVTAPTAGATVSGSVPLAATATDNVGVVGVQFKVDNVNVGAEDTSSPYGMSWNSTTVTNGTHTITAVARDAAGNTATSTSVTVTVTNAAPPSGLVAAFGFDETSGSSAADASGIGNNGSVSGATRSTAGRFGGALSFDGVNDSVSVLDAASLDLTNNLTLSAYVRPTGTSGWRTVLLKERPGGLAYSLYGSGDVPRPSGNLMIGTGEQQLVSPSALPANTWSHLAVTYNGSVLRLYVNGGEVATRNQTGNVTVSAGALKIGGNAIWNEWFAGLIDEVRIYNRALTAQQIQADMNTPITPTGPDTTAPTVSVTAPAAGATVSGSVNLTADAADNVAVGGVQFKIDGNNVGAEDTTAPYSVPWNSTTVANGAHTVTAVARDAADNTATSTSVTVTVTNAAPDTTAPTVSVTAPAAGATVSGSVNLTADAADNVAVAGVQFKIDGNNVGAEDTTAPYSVPWNSTTVANGAHTVTAVARDAAGNTATSTSVTVTVTNAPSSGLVVALGFDEVSGSSVVDASGSGNDGTVSGATRSTAGRFGGALSFDGVNDSVSVLDAASLDLTNNLTLSAYVRPTATSGWRTVLLKERPGGLAYSLYGSGDLPRPSGHLTIGSTERQLVSSSALPANTWSHLAFTYNGSVMRLYVNGVEVATQNRTGSATVSTGALKIGGNAIWSEWFAGLIDEVRIYNRALTVQQLQTDMNSPITPP